MKHAPLILLVLLLASCTELTNALSHLSHLQKIVSLKYQTKDVQVQLLNGNMVRVSLVNSTYNDSTVATRRLIACEIGKIVLDSFNTEQPVKFGRVAFVEHHNYIIANSTTSTEYDMKLDSLSKINTTQ